MTCARATSVLCSFSVVRCVSVGMCFERTLLPHQHAIAATLCVCKLYLYTLRSFRSALAPDPE